MKASFLIDIEGGVITIKALDKKGGKPGTGGNILLHENFLIEHSEDNPVWSKEREQEIAKRPFIS